MSGNEGDKDGKLRGIFHPYSAQISNESKNVSEIQTQNVTSEQDNRHKPELHADIVSSQQKGDMNVHPDTISSQNKSNITPSTEIESTLSKTEQTASKADRNKNKFSLRRGKWTPEEERYASLLIEEFEKGTVKDCENGCTLRAYLSRKLHCAPMRISKKFAGKSIGKHVFLARALTCNEFLLPGKVIQDNTDKLRELEFKFQMSLHHEGAGMLGVYRQNPPLILPNLFYQLNPSPHQSSGSQINTHGLPQSQNLMVTGQKHETLLPMPMIANTCNKNDQSHCAQQNHQGSVLKNSLFCSQNAISPAMIDRTMKIKDENCEANTGVNESIDPLDTSASIQRSASETSAIAVSVNYTDNLKVNDLTSKVYGDSDLSAYLGHDDLLHKVSNYSGLLKPGTVNSNLFSVQNSSIETNSPPVQDVRSRPTDPLDFNSGMQCSALDSSSREQDNSDLDNVDSFLYTSISSNMYALYAQQSAMAVSKHSAYCRSEALAFTQVEPGPLQEDETRTDQRSSRSAVIVEDDSTSGSSSTRKFINIKNKNNRSVSSSDKVDDGSRSSDSNHSQTQRADFSQLNSRKRQCPTTYNFSTISPHPDSVTVSELSSDVGTEPDCGTNSSKESSNDSGSGSDSACENNSSDQYDTISDEGNCQKSTHKKNKRLKIVESHVAGNSHSTKVSRHGQ